MNYFSDPQETASLFGDTIADFHDVFRCNGIDFGSPDDFFAFARTVKYHSELRSDVMRVVKSVMENEMKISFRTILTVIAVASGGVDFATSGREMGMPVNQIVEALISIEACVQINSDHADKSCLGLTALIADETGGTSALYGSTRDGGGATEHIDVTRQAEATFLEAAADPSVDRDAQAAQSTQSEATDYAVSNLLAESLTRLELNSLQVKLYLDSIDQRISRMEPRLENAPSLVPSAPPLHLKGKPESRFSAAISSVHEADPLWNGAARVNGTGVNQGDSATSGPEAALLRQLKDWRPPLLFRRQAALPVFVGIAVVVLAVSLWWRVDRSTGDVLMHPVNASSASVEGAANTAFPGVAQGAAASGLRVGTVSETRDASVSGGQGNSSASRYGYTDREVRQAAGSAAQLQKKSAQISSKSSLPLPVSRVAQVKMETDASEMTASPDRTYDLSSELLSNRLVIVSSGVMAANLVSGPKPSYPALASLTRTQGDVVMQAVISKNGTVEHLHVIKGHRLLRGAAKSAVRTWRYRPYKIDGVPVDVATIVSVDFSLHR